MAITGGIKVLEQSLCLLKNGADCTASSGDSSADLMLSMNRLLRWDSVGSNDTTSETLTITFDSTKIDRLFILGHNLKDYTITYGAGALAFTNVLGVDGLKSGISETEFAENTSYYEFDEVTTSQINITARKTQITDSDKYITGLIVTRELGTFKGYPSIKPNIDAEERRVKALSGKYITQKSFEVFNVKFSMQHTEQSDIDLFDTMFESQESFLLWLCGGKYGSSNFSVSFKNWRLQDLYQVQTYGRMNTSFRKNIYTSSPMTSLSLAEEV